jgi:hypothetical protein
MTTFLPSSINIRGIRDMIGTKDMKRMIGEAIGMKEMIGKLGKLGKLGRLGKFGMISMNEGIETDNTEIRIGTRKGKEAKIDIETITTVLRIIVGIIVVRALLPRQITLTCILLKDHTSQATVPIF